MSTDKEVKIQQIEKTGCSRPEKLSDRLITSLWIMLLSILFSVCFVFILCLSKECISSMTDCHNCYVFSPIMGVFVGMPIWWIINGQQL